MFAPSVASGLAAAAATEVDDPFLASSSHAPLGMPSFYANTSGFSQARSAKATRPASMSIFPSVLRSPRIGSTSLMGSPPLSELPRSPSIPHASSLSMSCGSQVEAWSSMVTSPGGAYSPHRSPTSPSSAHFAHAASDAEMSDAFATPPPAARPSHATINVRRSSLSTSSSGVVTGLPSPPPSSPLLSKKKMVSSSSSAPSASLKRIATPKIKTTRLQRLPTAPPTPPLTPLLTLVQQQQQSLLPVVDLAHPVAPTRPEALAPGPPPTLSARALRSYRLHPLFASQYTIQEELGAGGFGFVVRAIRYTDELSVAVKFIERAKIPAHGWAKSRNWGEAPGLSAMQGEHRVVPMEAFVLRSIRHEGVVAYIDLFEDEKYFYLVMEHHGSPWQSPGKNPAAFTSPSDLPALAAANGPSSVKPHQGPQTLTPDSSPMTASASLPQPASPQKLCPPRPAPMERRTSCDLFECIEQHNRLDENVAKYVFAQIVEVVAALSAIGIVHRDIKDENIVISNDWRVKLIDFGSAVIFDPRKPAPHYNRFHGTTSFASSEILRGEPYQAPVSEVWSLGVLLSILVTGEIPFADAEAAKAGRLSRPKVRLGNDVEHLMRSCLEVDVSKRLTIDDIRKHSWLARRPRAQ